MARNTVNKNLSKLRIDGIDDDTSPREVRELLEPLGDVAEVSINSGQVCLYALADMAYKDAEQATLYLDGTHWRGQRLSLTFANRGSRKRWLSSQNWKPPKDDEKIRKDQSGSKQ